MSPIRHSGFSRRSFLAASALSSGTLLLRPDCLFAAPARKKLSLVVVSDTHLGYKGGDGAKRQWAKTAPEIAAAEGDLVLHLGDIVDGGREEQYPVYLETRDTIGKPVYEIPGNHDPAELFAKYIRKPIDTVVEHDWLRILLLGNARRESHDGFLDEDQIAWLDAQCLEAAKTDQFVVVGMHVPAHSNKHPDRGWYVKPDHGQTKLYETLTQHKDRVIALWHGHFHNGIRGWHDHGPLHEICFPSALYNGDRHLEEQNAPGYNPLEFRPGFTLVTFEGRTMKLQYKPVGAEPSVAKELETPT